MVYLNIHQYLGIFLQLIHILVGMSKLLHDDQHYMFLYRNLYCRMDLQKQKFVH